MRHYLNTKIASVYFVGCDSQDQYWRPNANSKRAMSVSISLTKLPLSETLMLHWVKIQPLILVSQLKFFIHQLVLFSFQLNFWATIFFYDQYFYHSHMNSIFIILTFKYSFLTYLFGVKSQFFNSTSVFTPVSKCCVKCRFLSATITKLIND